MGSIQESYSGLGRSDNVRQNQLSGLFCSCPPYYALEIKYRHKCWLKCVRKYQKMSEDDLLPYMHNVTLCEAQAMFSDHVRRVIFKEHELRSLQSLLRDYSFIISRYGFSTSGVKSRSLRVKPASNPAHRGTTVN